MNALCKTRWFGLVLVVGIVVGAAMNVGSARADLQDDDKNPYVWRPKTKSVAVFKNGLGFFVREGEAEMHDGWCMARQIPPAAFGTLAIYAKNEHEVVDIVGAGPGEVVEFDDRDAPTDAKSKRTRLAAATNLKIELKYKQKGEERTAAGRLVSIGPRFAVLDTGKHSVAVPVEGIRRMQILELPLRLHVAQERSSRSSDAKSVEKTTLGMAYLRKGITWIPDYTLKVLDHQTAELTLRGTLVNEAEHLVHTDVHLVVGVPHFKHTQYMAPIAIGQVIRTIGAAVAGNMPGVVMSQAVMSRAAIVSNARTAPQFGAGNVVEAPVPVDAGDLNKALGDLPQLGGAAATDYTVYTKRDVTLRRGEKAIITLFTRKIKYSHIYRWSPPGRMEHSLVLHNSTDTPWTTGPCLALSDERPLSEDLLHYTPKGGRTELPVTTAINVAHEKSEREIERKLKVHSPARHVWLDLVTLEGKLQLRNFEKRDVHIVITNPVPGKTIEATDGGAISVDPTKLKLLERCGSVGWDVALKAGEKKTLTYQYERYVPSH